MVTILERGKMKEKNENSVREFLFFLVIARVRKRCAHENNKVRLV